MNWQESENIQNILSGCQQTLAIVWERHEDCMPLESDSCEDIMAVQLFMDVIIRRIERLKHEEIIKSVGLNLN